jgi:hypothetical protein
VKQKIAIALVLAGASTVSLAQTAISARIGSAGLGLGVTYSVAPQFDIRAEFAGAAISFPSPGDSDVDYDTRLKLSNGGLIGDYYVSKTGTFHISFGAFQSRNKLTLAVRPNTPTTVTLNDVDYLLQPGSSLSGEVKMTDGIVPYIGFGWNTRASEAKGFQFRRDFGLIFQRPQTTLQAVGLSGPTLETDLLAEQQKIQDSVGKFRVYPVVSLSIGWAF